MIPDPPALIARLAAGEGAAPALMWPGGGMGRRTLLRRIQGAAATVSPGEPLGVADREVSVWLPWLAGCALGGGVFRFAPEGTTAPPPDAARSAEAVPPETPFFAARTSGSTGAPRHLLRDRGGWERCFTAEAERFALSPDDRVLAVGGTAFSLTPYVALRSLYLGAPVGVLPRVTPAAGRRLLADLAPTILYGAPPLLAMLAHLDRRSGRQSAVRLLITGGARLTAGQRAALAAAWPTARVVQFYGAAETSFIAATDVTPVCERGDGERADGEGADWEGADGEGADMGAPFPGVSVRRDGEGRLQVRTPYAARAAMDAQGRETALADAAGWITLNDRVEITADGRVRVLGRSDDLINIGGALTDPAPLERALERLPGVFEAAVLAGSDPWRSEAAHIVLVGAAPPPANSRAAVRDALRVAGAEGSGLQARRVIWCRDPVPRGPGGKLDRRALAARMAAGTLAGEELFP